MTKKAVVVDSSRIKKHSHNDDKKGPVIYFMQRDQRVHDNWALLYAQQKAEELNESLAVVFCIDSDWYPKTLRHYDFMIKGLEQIEIELKKYKIPFYLLIGKPDKELYDFVEKYKIGSVITDFNPLKYYQKILKNICEKVSCSVYEVDAHNIIPCWITSQKQEYAARTIRSKIHKHLTTYLIDFPKISKKSIEWDYAIPAIAWKGLQKKIDLDDTVRPLDWIDSGEKSAHVMLDDFIKSGLKNYALLRNDPTENAQSNLSPYLHFGHISSQRVALKIKDISSGVESIKAFLEELIVRRELTDNYCYYNQKYDLVAGAAHWAQETLKKHEHDVRDYLYTKKVFENAKTHDELWNAAQLELMYHGKMHGYMRMYWAKKILEWSASPEHAMEIALYLNDKYSIDGTDPNGYVGVAWSIAGVHDRAWFPRKVFGTIRYMSYNGCKSKFDVQKYCSDIQKKIKKV